MDKFRNKYRISSTRLKNWDYGSHGFYSVTICTQNRECYFGDIVETQHVETQNIASLRYTKIGDMAYQYWSEIPKHYSFVELDEFIIMPNHVHGVLFFNRPNYDEWKTNVFGPQSQNLGAVIRGYKAAVKKYATIHQIDFAWQPRYHDHIIRSEKDLNNIRKYIMNNPARWWNDRFYNP